MIINRNTILFLSTTFLGASISAAAASDSTATAARQLQEPALQRTFRGRGAPPTPLPNCHGDCDNDNHCEGDLQCFQRYVLTVDIFDLNSVLRNHNSFI